MACVHFIRVPRYKMNMVGFVAGAAFACSLGELRVIMAFYIIGYDGRTTCGLRDLTRLKSPFPKHPHEAPGAWFDFVLAVP